MIIFLLVLWNLLLSLVVAHYGQKRQIGWVDSFFVSLIFSPLIGFICVALSDKLPPDMSHKPYSLNALFILLILLVILGAVFTYMEKYNTNNDTIFINNNQDSTCVSAIDSLSIDTSYIK